MNISHLLIPTFELLLSSIFCMGSLPNAFDFFTRYKGEWKIVLNIIIYCLLFVIFTYEITSLVFSILKKKWKENLVLSKKFLFIVTGLLISKAMWSILLGTTYFFTWKYYSWFIVAEVAFFFAIGRELFEDSVNHILFTPLDKVQSSEHLETPNRNEHRTDSTKPLLTNTDLETISFYPPVVNALHRTSPTSESSVKNTRLRRNLFPLSTLNDPLTQTSSPIFEPSNKDAFFEDRNTRPKALFSQSSEGISYRPKHLQDSKRQFVDTGLSATLRSSPDKKIITLENLDTLHSEHPNSKFQNQRKIESQTVSDQDLKRRLTYGESANNNSYLQIPTSRDLSKETLQALNRLFPIWFRYSKEDSADENINSIPYYPLRQSSINLDKIIPESHIPTNYVSELSTPKEFYKKSISEGRTIGIKLNPEIKYLRFGALKLHLWVMRKYCPFINSSTAMYFTGILEYVLVEIIETSICCAKQRTSNENIINDDITVTVSDLHETIKSDKEFIALIYKIGFI